MKVQKGISLTEVLVSLAALSIAGVLLMNLLVSSNNIFVKETIKVNQGLSLNQATLEITGLIKSSAGVVAQYPISGNALYTTNSQTLVLKIPAITSGDQIIDTVFDYAVIDVDPANSKILRKRIYPSGQSIRKPENKVLTTSLYSISFLFLNESNNPISPPQSQRINYSINLSDPAGLSKNESSASAVVNLKNL